MKHIVVVGTGAWGTALALSCLKAGNRVSLVARRPEFAEILQQTRRNERYLPGVTLPDTLTIHGNMAVVNEADLILLVTPAQATHDVCTQLRQIGLNPNIPIVLCAKGIDLQRHQLLTQTAQALLENSLAVLSGPSFADELGRNLPTAVTIAAATLDLAITIAQTLRHSRLRCYASDDLVGVQVGGALKNVLAIACGIVHGRQLGNNASAALMTRGLAEMRRFGLAMGGQSETFLGLSGVGDLILTGSSQQSRNFSLGFQLGQGKDLASILGERHNVTEGVYTAAAVYHMAEMRHIHMPVCTGVYELLHQNGLVDDIIEKILSKQSDLEF
jgi:glycerol-3-phosphate dehydrogenase (NAD(P)+)